MHITKRKSFPQYVDFFLSSSLPILAAPTAKFSEKNLFVESVPSENPAENISLKIRKKRQFSKIRFKCSSGHVGLKIPDFSKNRKKIILEKSYYICACTCLITGF